MTFCVLGENCSVFDRHTRTPGISIHHPLCEGCRNRSQRELNLLRYDYVDLSQLMEKKSVQEDAEISRPKPESSPTIDVNVLTLRSEIADVAQAAQAVVRDRLGMPVLWEKVREGYGLGYAVEFLVYRLDELARLPASVEVWAWREEQFILLDGPQTLLLVGALHRRARRMCGMDPRTIAIPGSCPSCAVPALLRHDDDPDRIWCSVCNKTLTEQGYLKAQRMQFAPVTQPPDPR